MALRVFKGQTTLARRVIFPFNVATVRPSSCSQKTGFTLFNSNLPLKPQYIPAGRVICMLCWGSRMQPAGGLQGFILIHWYLGFG
jgi:hypothetical protein